MLTLEFFLPGERQRRTVANVKPDDDLSKMFNLAKKKWSQPDAEFPAQAITTPDGTFCRSIDHFNGFGDYFKRVARVNQAATSVFGSITDLSVDGRIYGTCMRVISPSTNSTLHQPPPDTLTQTQKRSVCPEEIMSEPHRKRQKQAVSRSNNSKSDRNSKRKKQKKAVRVAVSTPPLPTPSYFDKVREQLGDHDNFKGSNTLRDYQKEMLASLSAHWAGPEADKPAFFHGCTGCGKSSGMISLAPFVENGARRRVLVIVPTQQLFDGVCKNLSGTFSFYNDFYMFPSHVSRPKVLRLRKGTKMSVEEIAKHDISVCTAAYLGRRSKVQVDGDDQKTEFKLDAEKLARIKEWEEEHRCPLFDLVIIDEAHYSPCDTWKRITDAVTGYSKKHSDVPPTRVLLLSATPFRSEFKWSTKKLLETLGAKMVGRFTLSDSSRLDECNLAEDGGTRFMNPLTKDQVYVEGPGSAAFDPEGGDEAMLEQQKGVLKDAHTIHMAKMRYGRNNVPLRVFAFVKRHDNAVKLAQWVNEQKWPAYHDDGESSNRYFHAEAMGSLNHPGQSQKGHEDILKRYKDKRMRRNNIDLLFTSGCLREGYDHPTISTVVLLVPGGIGSLNVLSSVVGRGSRWIPKKFFEDFSDGVLEDEQIMRVLNTEHVVTSKHFRSSARKYNKDNPAPTSRDMYRKYMDQERSFGSDEISASSALSSSSCSSSSSSLSGPTPRSSFSSSGRSFGSDEISASSVLSSSSCSSSSSSLSGPTPRSSSSSSGPRWCRMIMAPNRVSTQRPNWNKYEQVKRWDELLDYRQGAGVEDLI